MCACSLLATQVSWCSKGLSTVMVWISLLLCSLLFSDYHQYIEPPPPHSYNHHHHHHLTATTTTSQLQPPPPPPICTQLGGAGGLEAWSDDWWSNEMGWQGLTSRSSGKKWHPLPSTLLWLINLQTDWLCYVLCLYLYCSGRLVK